MSKIMLTRMAEGPKLFFKIPQVLQRRERYGKVRTGGLQKSVIPLVVLSSGEVPGTEQLVQQPPHVLPCNGAALQCGLDAVPHKDEEQ